MVAPRELGAAQSFERLVDVDLGQPWCEESGVDEAWQQGAIPARDQGFAGFPALLPFAGEQPSEGLVSRRRRGLGSRLEGAEGEQQGSEVPEVGAHGAE